MSRPNNGSPSSASLQRPSLLRGLDVEDVLEQANGGGPHTPWFVHDASLRPVPPFYPPLDPHCTAVVVDATPSVVAVRIAEALKKRSIAVEYDDETITACCMTVDRVHFCINLYRGGPANDSTTPDFSHAVIVECLRTRGDPMSFHWTCRAILSAAMGQSSGEDTRKPIRTMPFEFSRLKRVRAEDENILEPPAKRMSMSKPSKTSPAMLAMEHAMSLLKKDRLGAQRLGMESLVMLTDQRSSGVDTAVFCALAILGSREELILIHNWMLSLIRDGKLPTEVEEESAVMDTSTRSCVRSPTHTDATGSSAAEGSTRPAVQEDEHHGGILRALALRAFSNSLLVLSREKPNLLNSTLLVHAPLLVSEELLSALAQDLQGATRSPFAVTGTRLASPHEAALAAICLRVLAKHSEDAKSTMLRLQPPVLNALEKAHAARHDDLTREADRTFKSLSGDVIASYE